MIDSSLVDAAQLWRPDNSQRVVVQGLSDQTQATLDRLVTQLRDKYDRNFLRACIYDGKHAAENVSSAIPPMYHSLGLTLGWCGKAVDLLARRCNLEDFVWPDGDLNSLGFREVWDGNMLDSEMDQGIVSSLMHSPAFMVSTVGAADEPPALIHFKSALEATGEWDARTRRLKNLLSVTRWDANGRIAEFVLYLFGETITANRDSGEWRVVDIRTHPFGVPADPLVYKPRIGRRMGMSRMSRPMMSLQFGAMRELVRLEGHMDVYSIPLLAMLGADETLFKNPDGSMKAAWQVMLGRIFGIPDDQDADDPQLARADIKQFDASSPEPHLAAMNAWAKLFAREAQLPDTALAITDVSNPTSAESYDASQYELIAEAEGACDDWSVAARRTMVRSLAMANNESSIPPEWLSIEPRWRNPRFLSRSAEADAGSKQVAAIDWLKETEVGLELVGLDPQQIRRAMAEKRRAQATERLKLLTTAVGNGDAAAG